MKTGLVIAGMLFFLVGCKTMEAQPTEQNVEAAVPAASPAPAPPDTSSSPAPSSLTMEIPRGSSQNPAIAPAAAVPTVVVPEKPTKKEIQTALKNAGYYAGDIDGKFGPKTKKAVEEFQTANNLSVDGVVGPQTWDLLKKYLNSETQPSETQQQ
ncbi:hypothetical protein BU251_03590 [Candidatus Velamenicoccus archaeovorus]|uniref:Peptidoglycan binding-like domain-containing protein n=1 Tax=Velamenicoccus archaeovorus TaxID=1930593 RepID=A0A410P486_VELA1|nr:peptidoglycan-binding domain-containing protein [Candidatus Velamenicoccus archaeovorus]QAT16878.1 hypothetical protein BU251_03590 [Candidatus Velamenicoccus archaeovorus]